jgi:hypothetical protein
MKSEVPLPTVTLKIAIADADRTFASVLRAILQNVSDVSRVEIYDAPAKVIEGMERGEVNALFIDIFALGTAPGIELVSRIRELFSHIPICLLGSREQLATLPNVPAPWQKRFGHYYRLAKDQTADKLREEAEMIANRLGLYIISRTAKAKLNDVRDLLLHHPNELAHFGGDAERRIVEAIQIANTALEAKQAAPPPLQEIVPGFADTDVQSLVKNTVDRASSALDRTAFVNTGILLFGAILLLLSFVVASITQRWEAVAFGGFGIAGVIASLITNPLKSIGLGAQRLVQLQVAYLGFLNQIRLLNRNSPQIDEKMLLDRSKQLSDATTTVLKSLKEHFG